jgi:hypothetical protein
MKKTRGRRTHQSISVPFVQPIQRDKLAVAGGKSEILRPFVVVENGENIIVPGSFKGSSMDVFQEPAFFPLAATSASPSGFSSVISVIVKGSFSKPVVLILILG